MTEAEWRACTDPQVMLESLRGKASGRKLRLFAVACCRRVWPRIIWEESQRAVEVADAYSDGSASQGDLQICRRLATVPQKSRGEEDPDLTLLAHAACSACHPNADAAAYFAAKSVSHVSGGSHSAAVAALLMEIIGTPLRPVTLDPSWLNPNVVALARSIYDKRAFDRLPVLADALEGAGCSNSDILAHCRQPGEHVRGCWAVDLILGKG